MLKIDVDGVESFNQDTSEFTTGPGFTLRFEHSLVSLSKWESKYKVPFLSTPNKTQEQIMDYLGFMLLDDVDPSLLGFLSSDHLIMINEYIESTESATTFGHLPSEKAYRGEVITAELVYYWMVAFTIPFECENWHLNRLFALVRICNIKNSPGKSMPKADVARRNREINEQRKAKLGTSG